MTDPRGFTPWEHEPDEFDLQAEEDCRPRDDWQDHCGDPDCEDCPPVSGIGGQL